MKFSSWQLFFGFEQHDRDAARGGAFPIFFVTCIIGNRHLPVSFALFPVGLARNDIFLIFPFTWTAFGIFLKVVIPAGVVPPPKTGCDQGNSFPVNDTNERGCVKLARLCADGGAAELYTIPITRIQHVLSFVNLNTRPSSRWSQGQRKP
jgi:hypothetical protein